MISRLAPRRVALRFQGRDQSVSYADARRLVGLLTPETPAADAAAAIAAVRLEDALSKRRQTVVLDPADARRIVSELDRLAHDGTLTQDLHRLQLTLRLGLTPIV